MAINTEPLLARTAAVATSCRCTAHVTAQGRPLIDHPSASLGRNCPSGSLCLQVVAEGLAACTLAESCTLSKEVRPYEVFYRVLGRTYHSSCSHVFPLFEFNYK